MNKELVGKCIKSYDLKDYERLQRIGMLDKDTKTLDQLVNGKIESVVSRGNVIRVKLDNEINLILAPEYGGRLLYHASEKTVQSKFHLKVNFGDNTILTIRLTSMEGR